MMGRIATTLVCGWFLLAVPAGAQEAPGPVTGDAAAVPASAELAARVKEIEQDAGLDELARQALVEAYQEALRQLGEAERFRAQEQRFGASLQEGPAKVQQLRAELDALETTIADGVLPEGIGPESSTRAVEDALAREKAALATIQDEFKGYEDELTTIAKRASEIGERQVTANEELGEVQSGIAATSGDPGDELATARKLQLQARLAKLEAEIAMLEREAASDQIRISVAEAARDLTAKKVEAAEARVLELQKLATSLMADTLRKAEEAAKRIRARLPNPPTRIANLLGDSAALITETGRVANAITSAERELRERKEELHRVESALEDVKRLSDLNGQESVLGLELMEQLRALPASRDTERWASQTSAELSKARGIQFALQRALRDEAAAGAPERSAWEGVPDDVSADVDALLEAGAQLRQDLEAGNKRLIGALGDRLQAESQIEVASRELRSFAREEMILLRTAPVLGGDTLTSLPRALGHLFGAERVRELGQAIASVPITGWMIAALILGLVMGTRPLLGRLLRETGQATRRISTDRYWHTVVAFGVTLLLAAPVPLLAIALGLVLLQQPDPSYWSFALGRGLVDQWFFLLKVSFLVSACRRSGLAEMHFQWSGELLQRLRCLAWWWMLAYVPWELTKDLVFGEPEFAYLNNVGRISGMAMAVSLGVVTALIMHPRKGVAGALQARAPGSWFVRLRIFWFLLVIVLFAAIVVLLFLGYLFAGLILLEQIVKTLTAVMVAFVGYGMVLRWFAMRERRIAVEERLAEQRARLEARRERQGSEAVAEPVGSEEASLPEIQEEEPMDMARVGAQTRNLLGFLAGVLLLWRLGFIWSEISPVVNLLDGYSLFWDLSPADLGVTVLVIAALVAITRNLPGLLEVAVLRRLGLDAGTRTAITTLGKYVVIASGLAFLSHAIGMDWSRFGWIAAALSVGLGFGLQEVVANFVCGIILLFERPVRVGDVVTVDGIDGTVSRIQIRATTITNWDRKDFIVPNKQFVTGTLMNWTLSSGLNRIVINVGVAYGSDTERVHQVLSEAVQAHPDILEDPPPVVTFERFGDSSLDFVVRCYLPSLERRIAVIHELHTAIYARLNEAGIEIPFPQRDLHIKSGGAGLS